MGDNMGAPQDAKKYQQWIENLSKSKKGMIPWNLGIKGYSTSLKGRKQDKKWIENVSKALKGRKVWNKGLTKETDERVKQYGLSKRGEKNWGWKGDSVGRYALHLWIKSRKPKPLYCERCGLKKPYDLANISQKYYRKLDDWEWLCRRCHMEKDGRLKNLKRGGRYQ
jgi:hypothetical protein